MGEGYGGSEPDWRSEEIEQLVQPPPCRHCDAPLTTLFADLGATPLANDYLTPQRRYNAEPFYP